jgi:dTMP kinase
MSLIVIEGLDGSGKSSQVKNLKKYLEENNIKYKYIHFPQLETNIFGDMIAKFLRGEFGSIDQVDPYLVALLYAEDRNFSKEQINQWLTEGYVVLLDRYVNSNVAFQCAKSNEKDKLREWILNLEYIHFGIPKPDIEIFLDVPSNFIKRNLEKNREGEDRDYLKGKDDIHEASLDFQAQVREEYLKVFEQDEKLVKIECANAKGNMAEKDEVFGKILNILNPFISK